MRYAYSKGYRAKRSSYRKKYRRTPRNVLTTKYSVADIAQSAWKGVQYLGQLINSEKHMTDFASTVSPSSSGGVISLCGVAQGDTRSARTGNCILLSSILFREVFTLNGSATSSTIRRIVFIDTQQVADTDPSVGAVLESSSHLSPLNANSFGRFKILNDEMITVDNVGKRSCSTKHFIDKVQLHMRYNGANSTDIAKNGLYVLYISNEGTNTPAVDYSFRIGFYDN